MNFRSNFHDLIVRIWTYTRFLQSGELTDKKQRRNGTTQLHILNDFNIHKHSNAQMSNEALRISETSLQRKELSTFNLVNEFVTLKKAFNYLPQLLNIRG